MAVVNYATQVEDGTKTAPGYSFRQDTDTGVYRIGANNLGISVGDTKIVDIDTSGLNAIIGATTPAVGAFTSLSSVIASGVNFDLRKPAGPALQFSKTDAVAQTWQLGGDGSAFRLYDITRGAATPLVVSIAGVTTLEACSVTGDFSVATSKFTVASATGNTVVAGTGTIAGAFGCNTKAAQTAYASGGALAAYGAGVSGLDSGANMSALHAMVVSIRAALVANGVMS